MIIQALFHVPHGARWRQSAESLYASFLNNIHRRTDQTFSGLMGIQWVAGIAAALWISPSTWIGATNQIHLHVWAAVILGGMLSAFPIFLVWRFPGHTMTRHVVAIAQTLYSALLIHLTGGRIETHFHVFGSLAFLAFYRDWKVVLTATAVVTLDHFARGIFWPQSVFGVATASHWRWLEHAAWVVFEDVFLFISIRHSLTDVANVAIRRAQLEDHAEDIERQVAQRTVELTSEIAERKLAEAKLESMHYDLMTASRRAGMAEVATNVLHNVGNVLNSVNVSAGLVTDSVKKSRSSSLGRVVVLLQEHDQDLGAFLASDAKGKLILPHLSQLSAHLAEEQAGIVKELDSLRQNIEHIKEIVAVQQTYAKVGGVKEQVDVVSLVEDSLRMHTGGLDRHHVELIREFECKPTVTMDKHKVLQILVNLLRNAKHACQESERMDRRLTVRVANSDGKVKISVVDNGVGIAPENLTKIYNYGFTTRKDGHGFGLHSGALAAKEMGGALTARSEGLGKGAAFTLELPCAA